MLLDGVELECLELGDMVLAVGVDDQNINEDVFSFFNARRRVMGSVTLQRSPGLLVQMMEKTLSMGLILPWYIQGLCYHVIRFWLVENNNLHAEC